MWYVTYYLLSTNKYSWNRMNKWQYMYGIRCSMLFTFYIGCKCAHICRKRREVLMAKKRQSIHSSVSICVSQCVRENWNSTEKTFQQECKLFPCKNESLISSQVKFLCSTCIYYLYTFTWTENDFKMHFCNSIVFFLLLFHSHEMHYTLLVERTKQCLACSAWCSLFPFESTLSDNRLKLLNKSFFDVEVVHFHR